MIDWKSLLKQLADDPEDFNSDAGTVLFRRHGLDYEIDVKNIPGVGPAVQRVSGESQEYESVATYIQRAILNLPMLASQINRSLDKQYALRGGVPFIEPPARLRSGKTIKDSARGAQDLRNVLLSPEDGATHLVQLMARAGEGKTILIEHLAKELNSSYVPDPNPLPILLPVDLLGRYVGNIDDAIAGSLNNVYNFPQYSQKDIIQCLRNRWLILALDGFDELVARVGVRDAFLRVSELLEQLEGSGTVILSARASFFELYEITSGIRTYLSLNRGNYVLTEVNLGKWGRPQAIELFSKAGSSSPDEDVSGLLKAFESDYEIVFQPFFLSKLSKLWCEGERFETAKRETGLLSREKFVIETFIRRELGEKWIDRDSRKPYLSQHQHNVVLGTVAEEMWKTGAFKLTTEELRIAAELAMSELGLGKDIVDTIIERIPTHAAIPPRDKYHSFLHEQLFTFFLGYRIAHLLVAGSTHALTKVLSPKELSPSSIEWVMWALRSQEADTAKVLILLDAVLKDVGTGPGPSNIGYLIAAMLDDVKSTFRLVGHTFIGTALLGKRLEGISFENCRIWNCDLTGTALVRCELVDCSLSDVKVDESTNLDSTRFSHCKFSRLEVGSFSLYAPGEIDRYLSNTLKAQVVRQTTRIVATPAVRPIPEEVRKCADLMVRMAMRTTDFAIEGLIEDCGKVAKEVVKIGLEEGVLRRISRHTSGPRQDLVRFCVDRDRFLQGQIQEQVDLRITAFWRRARDAKP